MAVQRLQNGAASSASECGAISFLRAQGLAAGTLTHAKVTPFLWFDEPAEQAVNFYVSAELLPYSIPCFAII